MEWRGYSSPLSDEAPGAGKSLQSGFHTAQESLGLVPSSCTFWHQTLTSLESLKSGSQPRKRLLGQSEGTQLLAGVGTIPAEAAERLRLPLLGWPCGKGCRGRVSQSQAPTFKPGLELRGPEDRGQEGTNPKGTKSPWRGRERRGDSESGGK